MRTFLQKPYPFLYSMRVIGQLGAYIFVLGFLFLYLFEPFNVNRDEHKFSYPIICLFHTLTAVVAFYLVLFPAQKLIEKKDEWTLGKEILLVSLVLILVGIANFLIRDIIYASNSNWTLPILWEEIRNALLIGSMFYYLFLSINFQRLNRQNIQRANKIPLPQAQTAVSQIISIPTQAKNEKFLTRPFQVCVGKSRRQLPGSTYVGSIKILQRRDPPYLERNGKLPGKISLHL